MSDFLFFDTRQVTSSDNTQVHQVVAVSENGDSVCIFNAPTHEFAKSVASTMDVVLRAFERGMTEANAKLLSESIAGHAMDAGNAAVEGAVEIARLTGSQKQK